MAASDIIMNNKAVVFIFTQFNVNKKQLSELTCSFSLTESYKYQNTDGCENT